MFQILQIQKPTSLQRSQKNILETKSVNQRSEKIKDGRKIYLNQCQQFLLAICVFYVFSFFLEVDS